MSSIEVEGQTSRNRALIPALIGAIVATGLFCGLWLASRSTSPEEIDRALDQEALDARATADEVIELLINLDAGNVDEAGERVLELSTGNFREDYEELLPGLGPAFEESGASASGEIIDGPDVAFTASDEAVAIARVAQTTTVAGTERSVGFTLRLTLVKDDGAWKADTFELLGEL
ncbi:MAG: hypothetical protein ACRDJT_13310 [Actinomycetota bacterium]